MNLVFIRGLRADIREGTRLCTRGTVNAHHIRAGEKSVEGKGDDLHTGIHMGGISGK